VTSSFRLGRLAGVEIGIHWSWALIFALIVWSLADVVFPETNPGLANGTYLAMAIIAVLLFFASLLAHELGHATRAAKEGMEIDGITLWIFGGVARFRGMFPSAGAEFRIAIAGPIVSLAVGVLALGAALLVPLPAAVDGGLFWLGYVNLVVLVFNLMPALPLDGGRVLRSALWARKHDFLAATRTAAAVGQGFGQLLIGFGVLTVLLGGSLGGLWLVFIGWFILAAAEAERAGAETHEALSGVLVRDVMVTDPITVDPDLDLEQFIDRCFLAHRHVAYPVVEAERPVGLVSFRSVLALPREQWPQRRVRDAMVELARLPELGPETPLETAVERISQTESNRGLVLDRGRLAGLLSITDATRVIEARRAQGANPGSQRRHEAAAATTPPGLGASEGMR
jgi:Zn-dependent protease/predicted transcriptional regulator